MEYSTSFLISAATHSSYGYWASTYLCFYFLLCFGSLGILLSFTSGMMFSDSKAPIFVTMYMFLLLLGYPRLPMLYYATVTPRYASIINEHIYNKELSDMKENTNYNDAQNSSIILLLKYTVSDLGLRENSPYYLQFQTKLLSHIPAGINVTQEDIFDAIEPQFYSCMNIKKLEPASSEVKTMMKQMNHNKIICVQDAASQLLVQPQLDHFIQHITEH